MKALTTALFLTLSLTTLAKTSAVDGLKSIVEAGTFQGQNCSVTVSHNGSTSVVEVSAFGLTDSFAIINTTSSASYTAVYNENTGELIGSQSLNFPRYTNGGRKHFSAKALANGKAVISISSVLFDHRGNDASTYVTCEISK